MRKLKAENSKDFSQGHMGDKDPPAGVLHSYLQMDQAGSLRSDSASWERLQLEQPPNLGAPIWPPTEPAGDSVLSWDLPPQWVPLRSLSSKQRALSGAFSHQSFGSFFRLPPRTGGVGEGTGTGDAQGSDPADARSRTRLSHNLSQEFSSKNSMGLSKPASSLDPGLWPKSVRACTPFWAGFKFSCVEHSWPQLGWPLGDSVA